MIDTSTRNPAKGLRISRKTGFHIDFTVLAEFHIHDVVIIALDDHCLSRTPNEPQAGWDTSSTSIDQKPKSTTNNHSKDIRYGDMVFLLLKFYFVVVSPEVIYNLSKTMVTWWGCRKPFTLQMIFKHLPCEVQRREQYVPHHHKQPQKAVEKLPKEERIQDQTKSLQWVTVFKEFTIKVSKHVTLGTVNLQ